MNSTRFTLLPVGSRFEYEGKRYVKSSPLLAAAADGSGQRMIPRSAMVEVETGSAPPPRRVPESIPVAPLLDALARYHAEAIACVAEETAREGAVARIEAARAQLLESLGL